MESKTVSSIYVRSNKKVGMSIIELTILSILRLQYIAINYNFSSYKTLNFPFNFWTGKYNVTHLSVMHSKTTEYKEKEK